MVWHWVGPRSVEGNAAEEEADGSDDQRSASDSTRHNHAACFGDRSHQARRDSSDRCDGNPEHHAQGQQYNHGNADGESGAASILDFRPERLGHALLLTSQAR